jgi:excisionase family DNA binding protein
MTKQYSPAEIPKSEIEQVHELYKLLQLGPPALIGPNGSDKLDLPASIYRILKDVVSRIKEGKTIVLIPEDEMLTTQTAANFLGVSRPFLIKLLETGEIPFTKIGSHRRISLRDVLEFSRRRDKDRKIVLDNLAKKSLEEGLYEATPIPPGGEDE